MQCIPKLRARHKCMILFGENLRVARRTTSACEYHCMTNFTYCSIGNIKTPRTLNKSFTGYNLISFAKYFSICPTRHPNFLVSNSCRKLCAQAQGQTPLNVDQYMDCSDENTKNELKDDMLITYDFISEEEENQLMNEIEPYLKRLRYESNHWDDAIHGYRETERRKWTEKNTAIIQRVRDVAFPPGTPQLAYVHVLDLKKEGYIKPHVDAVKFCGNTVAGICLMSPAIMRLVHNEDNTKFADILLERRCLYIMKDIARYDYTHEVLKEEESTFRGRKIVKDRRISIICRNEPKV